MLLKSLKDTQLLITSIAAASVGATRGKNFLDKLARDAKEGRLYRSSSQCRHCRQSRPTPADGRDPPAEADKKRRRRAEKAQLRAWTAEASSHIRVEDISADGAAQVGLCCTLYRMPHMSLC